MSHSTHSKAAVTSSDVLGDAKALAEKISALVGPAPALTKADVQRSAKLRKGGRTIVKTVTALSDKLGLVIPSYPTATLVEKVDQAESLVALHQELVTATKHVADAMFRAQSESWAGATAHYTMLRRLGRADGSINTTLQPAIQFFASRSAAVQDGAKESRGGARKGTAKAKAYRATKRAEEAKALASSENPAPAASNAPTAATSANGVPASPSATTPVSSNGSGH